MPGISLIWEWSDKGMISNKRYGGVRSREDLWACARARTGTCGPGVEGA